MPTRVKAHTRVRGGKRITVKAYLRGASSAPIGGKRGAPSAGRTTTVTTGPSFNPKTTQLKSNSRGRITRVKRTSLRAKPSKEFPGTQDITKHTTFSKTGPRGRKARSRRPSAVAKSLARKQNLLADFTRTKNRHR